MEIFSLLASTSTSDIENGIKSFSIRTVLIATLLLVVLILTSSKLIKKKKHKKLKKPLFIIIAATIALPTLLMTGSTIYLNTISDSGGPVHWHTDIEFWVCGQEIELRDPYKFMSNKIGTSTYHEHDDKRIHLEGVVIETEYDASLEKLLSVAGGELTSSALVIPTEDTIFEDDIDGDIATGDQELVRSFLTRDDEQRALLSVQNGQSCSKDNGYAEVQGFLYKYDKSNDTYSQTKLADPKSYVMRDESIVPPGDCVIIEFDVVKDRTNKLCLQYGVIDKDRCTTFGVDNFNPKVCKIREINSTEEPI